MPILSFGQKSKYGERMKLKRFLNMFKAEAMKIKDFAGFVEKEDPELFVAYFTKKKELDTKINRVKTFYVLCMEIDKQYECREYRNNHNEITVIIKGHYIYLILDSEISR